MKCPKKALKWTAVVLGGLVAIGLVANAIFVWTTDTLLERQLAEIRAAGDPLTLADLARPPIPPEKNAATYLRRAEGNIDAIMKEVEAVPHFWEWFGTKEPMPAQIQKALKTVFLAYHDVIPLLQQAAACPGYDPKLDCTLPAEQFLATLLSLPFQEIRADVRVLEFRARLLLAEGNNDEALRTAIILFRLARHWSHNPMIIGYLVTVTIQNIAVDYANLVLQAGPVSTKVRDALNAELVTQERMEGYTWAYKSERAFVLDSFRNIARGRNVWLFRGYWNRQESEVLEVFRANVAMTVAPGPYCQTDRAIRRANNQIAQIMSAQAQSLAPSIDAVHHVTARVRAMIRCLRVLNTLQTHVPSGSKEIPKLAELGLPAETVTDPFTGEPLHVKKTPRGWLVYSVGPNFRYDGGKLDDPINGDVGVGPPASVAKPAKNDQVKNAKKGR
jgi:hypothetical protein